MLRSRAPHALAEKLCDRPTSRAQPAPGGRRKGLVPPHTDTPGPWTMWDDAIGPDAVVEAARALGFATYVGPLHGDPDSTIAVIAAHDGQARSLGYGSRRPPSRA